MELKTKDLYHIECSDRLSTDLMISLMSLYQPIIGSHAISLYLTLFSEGLNQHARESHLRLTKILHLGIDEIERARMALEGMLLLKTYMKSPESGHHIYMYVLNMPLSTSGFMKNREFMSILLNEVGQKQLDLTVTKLNKSTLSLDGFDEVTAPVVYQTQSYQYDIESKIQAVKPKYQFSKDTFIQFDYERFIQSTSTLVFPIELRTQENLAMIGKLATIYGISVDRMRILVSRCVNLSTMSLDLEQLKILSEKTAPDIIHSEDPYALPPVSFLQAKQNGAPVSLTDRKILENLALNTNFTVEVINIMIEYILQISQNRLVQKFVDMVAGEWARDGVDSKEKALAQTKKKVSQKKYSKPVVPLPSYLDENVSQLPVSDEKRQEVEALLRKMRKNNG